MSRREKLRKARKRERRRIEESARYLQAVAGAPPRAVVSPEVYETLRRDATLRGFSIGGQVAHEQDAAGQVRGVAGRLIVDDINDTPERALTERERERAMAWYRETLPGSGEGVVASGQIRVPGPLTGMSIGGYVSDSLQRKEDIVSKHQDQSVSFLRDLATYLGADGWDRLQHMVCHFDPTDGSWTLSLRVEDGDKISVYDGINSHGPQVGDFVSVDSAGRVRATAPGGAGIIGVVSETQVDGRVTVMLDRSVIPGSQGQGYQSGAMVTLEAAPSPTYGPREPWLRRHACPGQFHHLGRRLSADSFSLPRSEALERMASIYARMAQEARDQEADEEIRRRASGPEPRPTAAGSP